MSGCLLCGAMIFAPPTACGYVERSTGPLVEHLSARVGQSWHAHDAAGNRVLESDTLYACRPCVRTGAGADLFARLVGAEVLRRAFTGGPS